jgi:phosphoserine phosphatase
MRARRKQLKEGNDMNVYDFDNTILRGDSTARFFAYCLLHCPRMWADIPGQLANAALFACKRRALQPFKERLLGFVARLGDVDATVEAFWRSNMRRVKPWYMQQHRDDDVVISASPEFLIRPACAHLRIACAMGSPVDKHTGRFLGLNCRDHEKVRRFKEVCPNGKIEEFYSDSYSDAPLAELAERAWLVQGDRKIPWNSDKHE